jgi:hypothetical protein
MVEKKDRIRKLEEMLSIRLDYSETGMEQMPFHGNTTGFFPFCSGIWCNDGTRVEFPFQKIMILGQDFGTNLYMNRLRDKQGENVDNQQTWVELRYMLSEVSIPLQDCLYTNAIMGIRASGSGTGVNPAFKNKNARGITFIKECFTKIFIEQVRIQEPKLIICMGKQVYEFLKLNGVEGLENYDVRQSCKNLICNSEFGKLLTTHVEGIPTSLLLIVHPYARKIKEDVPFPLKIDIERIKEAVVRYRSL